MSHTRRQTPTTARVAAAAWLILVAGGVAGCASAGRPAARDKGAERAAAQAAILHLHEHAPWSLPLHYYAEAVDRGAVWEVSVDVPPSVYGRPVVRLEKQTLKVIDAHVTYPVESSPGSPTFRGFLGSDALGPKP